MSDLHERMERAARKHREFPPGHHWAMTAAFNEAGVPELLRERDEAVARAEKAERALEDAQATAQAYAKALSKIANGPWSPPLEPWSAAEALIALRRHPIKEPT